MDKQYWLSPLGELDDFGKPYTGVMYDGATVIVKNGKKMRGPAANMSQESWEEHGISIVKYGFAQMYVKTKAGKWLLAAGDCEDTLE